MTPLNSSRQDIYTRHTAERPCLKTLTVQNDSSYKKRVPFSVALPRTAACLSARQPWSRLDKASTSGEHLPLCSSRSVWQQEGKQCGAVLGHGKWSEANAPQFPPVVWQKQMGGCRMGKLGDNIEAWDGFLSPSQSSVVSQLTSRGTWRHLVPVWMTVTVEGRGRGGSATTDDSSQTGEGASESWSYALTAEGNGAIGGPVGENVVACHWRSNRGERNSLWIFQFAQLTH